MSGAAAVKVAAIAVKNKDKIGKVVLYAALVVAVVCMLASGAFLSILSAFSTEGTLKSPEVMSGEDSVVGRAVSEAAEPFYKELEETLEERREDLIEAHTVSYDIVDSKGKTITVTNKPSVTRRVNYVPENLIIAYLMQAGGIDTETGTVDGDKAREFLETVCTVTETETGNMEYLVENTVLSEDGIADVCFETEQKKSMFHAMCGAYEDYFDAGTIKNIADDGEETVGGSFASSIPDVPLYLQYDAQWGGTAYGSSTIKKSGCCPTCLAMVFSYLCQRNVYPDEIAAWAGSRYYIKGSGTSWAVFEPAAERYGVQCANIGKDQGKMTEALGNGKLVVASMGPGTFTKGGHFIVLTGMTENGKIKVNDPNDSGSKQHINKEFEVSLILRESKNMWVFGR